MLRQVIVTNVPADNRYRNKIMKWGREGKLGEKINVIPLDDGYFYDDGELNRERLAWTLKDAAMVLILVGADTRNHPWMEWEGEFCHQWGITRRIMRIPYSEGRLPEPFELLRDIAYNPNAIEKEIRDTVKNDHFYH